MTKSLLNKTPSISVISLFSLLVLSLGLFAPSSCLSSSEKPEHLRIAERFLGIAERKPNRSLIADSANKYVKNPLGSAYCAATWSYILHFTNAKTQFRTGLAKNLITKETFSALEVLMGRKQIKAGYLIIWSYGKTIHGHVEAASKDWDKDKGQTYGANSTNKRTKQEGFWPQERKIEPLNYFRIVKITPVRY